MPIQFNCPCGKMLRVPDEFAGRRAKCPGCAALVDIPGPDPVFEVVEKPKPAANPSAKPGVKYGKPNDDDDDERGTYGLARD
jgi:hypothetical protein